MRSPGSIGAPRLPGRYHSRPPPFTSPSNGWVVIRLGAYRTGSSARSGEAIAFHKPLEAFQSQSKEEATTMAEGYDRLERILRGEETQN